MCTLAKQDGDLKARTRVSLFVVFGGTTRTSQKTENGVPSLYKNRTKHVEYTTAAHAMRRSELSYCTCIQTCVRMSSLTLVNMG